MNLFLIKYLWSRMYFYIIEALIVFCASSKIYLSKVCNWYNFNPNVINISYNFPSEFCQKSYVNIFNPNTQTPLHFGLQIFSHDITGVGPWQLLDSILFFQKKFLLARSISFLMYLEILISCKFELTRQFYLHMIGFEHSIQPIYLRLFS